jgi:FlaA1/EpsC-like NDP-sugar epimerase
MGKIFSQYHNLRLPACLVLEFLLISAAVMLAALLRFSHGDSALASALPYSLRAFLMAAVCQLCMYYADLYDLRVALSGRTLLIKLAQSLGVAAVVLMGLFYLLPQLSAGRGIFVPGLLLAFGLLIAWRLFYQGLHAINHFRIKVLIVGTSEDARKLIGELADKQQLGYDVRGFIGESDEVGKELL